MSFEKNQVTAELKRRAMKAAIERYNVVAFDEPPPVEAIGLDLAVEVYDEVMLGAEPGEMSQALGDAVDDDEAHFMVAFRAKVLMAAGNND